MSWDEMAFFVIEYPTFTFLNETDDFSYAIEFLMFFPILLSVFTSLLKYSYDCID